MRASLHEMRSSKLEPLHRKPPGIINVMTLDIQGFHPDAAQEKLRKGRRRLVHRNEAASPSTSLQPLKTLRPITSSGCWTPLTCVGVSLRIVDMCQIARVRAWRSRPQMRLARGPARLRLAATISAPLAASCGRPLRLIEISPAYASLLDRDRASQTASGRCGNAALISMIHYSVPLQRRLLIRHWSRILD